MYAILDRPYIITLIQKFPAFYLDGVKLKDKLLINFFGKVVFEAVIQSIFIFYIALYSVRYSHDKDGYNSDMSMMSVLILLSIISIVNLKVAFN